MDISGGVSHTRKEFVAPLDQGLQRARGRIEKRRHGGDVSGGDDDDQLRIVRLGQHDVGETHPSRVVRRDELRRFW